VVNLLYDKVINSRTGYHTQEQKVHLEVWMKQVLSYRWMLYTSVL